MKTLTVGHTHSHLYFTLFRWSNEFDVACFFFLSRTCCGRFATLLAIRSNKHIWVNWLWRGRKKTQHDKRESHAQSYLCNYTKPNWNGCCFFTLRFFIYDNGQSLSFILENEPSIFFSLSLQHSFIQSTTRTTWLQHRSSVQCSCLLCSATL